MSNKQPDNTLMDNQCRAQQRDLRHTDGCAKNKTKNLTKDIDKLYCFCI